MPEGPIKSAVEVRSLVSESVTTGDEELSQAFVIGRDDTQMFAKQISLSDVHPANRSIRILDNPNRGTTAESSNKDARIGILPHLYRKERLASLRTVDTHHDTCLRVKINATVGVGFMTEEEIRIKKKTQVEAEKLQAHNLEVSLRDPDRHVKEDKKDAKETKVEKSVPLTEQQLDQLSEAILKQLSLDPMQEKSKCEEVLDDLCPHSFQDLLTSVCEDLETGDGFMEVKRQGDTIVALYHIPAHTCFVAVESHGGDYHWAIEDSAESTGGRRHFARFGDKKGFIDRFTKGDMRGAIPAELAALQMDTDPDRVSEVIHFRMPTGKSRYYGSCDWLSAVPNIELSRSLTQYKYDFFNNRGVPEFIVAITGGKLSKTDWKKVKDALYSTQSGASKGSRKSVAINVENPQIKIEVHKIGAENMADTFKDDAETVATRVVSAHGVPPLLANILIPGKMGSVNELPNALIAFQSVLVTQRQRTISRTLVRTLGSSEAGLGLLPEHFIFRKITDLLNVKEMDTISRMRESLGAGRDPSGGLKE